MVDDNLQNLKVLGKVLRGNGYIPVAAQSGAQALEFVQREKPDVILLDILMPGMDGYEVCEKLRKDAGTKDIPVIFLTSQTGTQDLVRAFEAGGVDYVTKPFNSMELLVRVKSQLDLKKAEAELMKSMKLETVGILSAGIAHDFNNLLAIILGNLEMAKKKIDSSDTRSTAFIDAAETASNQSAELVKKFLTISEGSWATMAVVAFADILSETLDSAPELRELHCTISLPDDIKPLTADGRQLRQVMVNLLLNARDATDGKGEDRDIRISVQNSILADDNPWSLAGGEYVKVSVSDNGGGIPGDVMAKILDPYFSTKERGVKKGMGMGLAVCHAIVQKHNGHMAFTSSPPAGATVDLYLPVYHE